MPPWNKIPAGNTLSIDKQGLKHGLDLLPSGIDCQGGTILRVARY